MPKSSQKGKELSESDFRLIKERIGSLTGEDYTTEYIRKVYNGNRNNVTIRIQISKYTKLKREFESKLKK